jgi:hypothetical protein
MKRPGYSATLNEHMACEWQDYAEALEAEVDRLREVRDIARPFLREAANGLDELAGEIVERGHTDRAISRAQRLGALADWLRQAAAKEATS